MNVRKDRKTYRMWKIVSLALSVLVKVYWYRLANKTEAEWDELWDKFGRRFRETLFELEGLLIKVGQMLSIRGDILPNSFIAQIQDLVDQVPPSPWPEIKQVLETEWNGPVEQRLLAIDGQPIASASIGEVYRATLLDGTKVAVKVQRPTIKSIIKTDFRSLAVIFWIARHLAPIPKGFINFRQLYRELKLVIERELDFKKEMDTLMLFRSRFNRFERLTIPRAFPEHCTSKVLLMEWVEGARVTDTIFLEKQGIDREKLARYLLKVFLPQWLEAGVFHADPHAGNVLVREDGSLVLLDFGMVGEISNKDAANFQDLIEAVLVKNYTRAAELLIDLGFLLPDVDLKQIEGLMKEALSFDLAKMKEMDLFAVKKEMNAIVRSLPIQVPTRFIFLGRAFVTIEGMLHTIHPDADLMEIVKGEFSDWLDQSGLSKWKIVLKWVNNQPVFKAVHSFSALLDAPRQYMVQKEELQKQQLAFAMYESQKRHSFYTWLLATAFGAWSYYFNEEVLLYAAAGLAAAACVSYAAAVFHQKSVLKSGTARRPR